MTECDDKKVIIICGGPAGLTASFKLCEQGVKFVMLEKDDVVGELARTFPCKEKKGLGTY